MKDLSGYKAISRTSTQVPLRELAVGQTYITDEAYERRKESQRIRGQYEPVILRNIARVNQRPVYEILVGHATVAIAKEFGWKSVNAITHLDYVYKERPQEDFFATDAYFLRWIAQSTEVSTQVRHKEIRDGFERFIREYALVCYLNDTYLLDYDLRRVLQRKPAKRWQPIQLTAENWVWQRNELYAKLRYFCDQQGGDYQSLIFQLSGSVEIKDVWKDATAVMRGYSKNAETLAVYTSYFNFIGINGENFLKNNCKSDGSKRARRGAKESRPVDELVREFKEVWAKFPKRGLRAEEERVVIQATQLLKSIISVSV